MAFNARIVFTGLCAFVPNKPFEEGPDTVHVLLPDLRLPRIVREDYPPLSPHFPVVTFASENLQEGSPGQPDRKYLIGKKTRFLSAAAAREVRIEPDGKNHDGDRQLQVIANGLNGKERPANGQEADLHWLLRGADAGAALVRSDLPLTRGPLTDEITTRVKLGFGTLKTHRLHRDPNGGLILWRFEPDPKKRGGRAVATQLAWEITGVKTHLDVVFHDGNAADKPIRLVPRKGATPDEWVEVRIENSEIERVLGLEDLLFDDGAGPIEYDSDVAAYASLASVRPTEAPILVAEDQGHTGDRKACSPCGFNGVAEGGA
ncbi:MAG: hypothetical protein D6696_02945 [Acidobacteria bacterium]|nr:MAG: hypothetical protein D6696_02945 [Acidobacteriota bacterium]